MRSLVRWLGGLGALVVIFVVGTTYTCAPTYDDALADFRAVRATYQAAEQAVGDTVFAHLPPGTPLDRVTAYLDSLGYVKGTDWKDRRKSYYTWSTDGRTRLEAQAPYNDPVLSISRFVCDHPALRLTFEFDSAGQFRSLGVTSARACV